MTTVPNVVVQNSDIEDSTFFNALRQQEYPQLDANHQVYLDYTGGNQYSSTQIKTHFARLQGAVFGNPHSLNPASAVSTKMVEDARKKILEFFNADNYYCIFTSNATGALKIVGECYPFEENGRFVLLADNHNSVNGIREYCHSKGGSFAYSPIHFEDLELDAGVLQKLLEDDTPYRHKLFAFPAQSNVSGVRHHLKWIQTAQALGWDVLLDAAAFVPTTQLNLQEVTPDFVSVSFYKIFGYPTGIGCLLVRKDKFHLLHKRWFAGGTVTAVSIFSPHHFLAGNHERFEDGTVNYLDIPAVTTGLEFIEGIGMDRIHLRMENLMHYLIPRLTALQHSNGRELLHIFGPRNRAACGGTIVLNIFDIHGNQYPFEHIEQDASKMGISIRSGCFCNPGIDETNNCLTAEELSRYYSSRDNGDFRDMMQYLGKMRGAIRISVGIPTTQSDLDTCIRFISNYIDKEVMA
ncbi:MAG TPA: aminotransferase class V-fold PLP-dependent enzyme [Chitinophagales bacterium]|nr:aminotransferase class V-fold PLP-dependent enzyme [Chitinophagales bacterium]